jgi:hypothetical protein
MGDGLFTSTACSVLALLRYTHILKLSLELLQPDQDSIS